jgi:hypothetical protein
MTLLIPIFIISLYLFARHEVGAYCSEKGYDGYSTDTKYCTTCYENQAGKEVCENAHKVPTRTEKRKIAQVAE